MRTFDNLQHEEEKNKGNVNEENIYKMLHEFRNWNKDWDAFMAKKPKSADQFVAMLAKKYEVRPK